MSETQVREGGCACGSVRFHVVGDPILTHCCHCSYCQRENGAAFAVNLLYERDRVTIEGETVEVVTPSASGKGQRILRCPKCHVAVSSHYPGGGEAVHFIRGGTLDDRSDIRPDVHIYISSKQAWVETRDAPEFEEFYNPSEFWSEEQMRRWKEATSA